MNSPTQNGLVTNLASEGQGIVRDDGFVTFIPFTAKDDQINYQVVKKKKNFAIGKLLEILQPGPDRIAPKCQYYGVCGGCQLQHINYPTQLENKRQWVEDALRKIGNFQAIDVPPVTPSLLQWSYRRRIHLSLVPQNGHFQAGFIATDQHSLLPVENCPIFTEIGDPILHTLQIICEKLESHSSLNAKATVLKNEKGYMVHFHFGVMPPNGNEILSNCLKNYPFITGLLATSPKKSLKFGSIETSCTIEGLSFEFTPQTFIQNHPEQSLNIYKMIESLAEKEKPKKILDLYCGIGISSLLLARLGCHVKGVEINPKSIELAKINAKKNALPTAQFVTADVENVVSKLFVEETYDWIIVNPPREGLSPKVTQTLVKSSATVLIYISCMPSTLSRDLKLLCAEDYRIKQIKCYDMFPQTIHVETVVVLRRECNEKEIHSF